MTKQEFLAQLRKGLAALPPQEREERLAFYGEMIDDRMEEGLPEQEAVASIGTPEAIISQIMEESGRETPPPRREMSTGMILLLVLGSPVWLPLLISAVAMVFSLYIAVWSIIVALWSVFGSVAVCAVVSPISGIILAFNGFILPGLAVIGGGLVFGGLSILLFYGCHWVTKGVVQLTKKLAVAIRSAFRRKENAQ